MLVIRVCLQGKVVKTVLSHGPKKAVKSIQTATLGNNGYRTDLVRAALARYTQLARSLRPKAPAS